MQNFHIQPHTLYICSMQRLRSILAQKPVVTYPKRTEHKVHVVLDLNSRTGFKGLPNELVLKIGNNVLRNDHKKVLDAEKDVSTILYSISEFPVVPNGVVTIMDAAVNVPIPPSRRLSIPPCDPVYIEGIDPMYTSRCQGIECVDISEWKMRENFRFRILLCDFARTT